MAQTQRHEPPVPATQEPPATGTELAVVDFQGDYGQGFENLAKEEQLTPFLTLLQNNSPQCERAKSEYLPDARPGMFFDTATQERFDGDQGLEIVPCHREYIFTEWVHRDAGGGFRGVHAPEDEIVKEAMAKLSREKKNKFRDMVWVDEAAKVHLTEQFNLFFLYGRAPLRAETANRAVMAFTKTKIKPYQLFINTALRIRYLDSATKKPFMPNLWAHRWHLTSLATTNDRNQSYFVPRLVLVAGPGTLPIKSLLQRTDGLYALATDFAKQLRTGEARADYTKSEADADASGVAEMMGDEIPF